MLRDRVLLCGPEKHSYAGPCKANEFHSTRRDSSKDIKKWSAINRPEQLKKTSGVEAWRRPKEGRRSISPDRRHPVLLAASRQSQDVRQRAGPLIETGDIRHVTGGHAIGGQVAGDHELVASEVRGQPAEGRKDVRTQQYGVGGSYFRGHVSGAGQHNHMIRKEGDGQNFFDWISGGSENGVWGQGSMSVEKERKGAEAWGKKKEKEGFIEEVLSGMGW